MQCTLPENVFLGIILKQKKTMSESEFCKVIIFGTFLDQKLYNNKKSLLSVDRTSLTIEKLDSKEKKISFFIQKMVEDMQKNMVKT